MTMTGENIVCFAKEWTEDPTSNNHVMRTLARHNNVLWLNSVGTRNPDLGSGRDLRKMARRLLGFFTPPQQVEERLWVYSPIVLPLPYSAVAVAVNKWILRATIALLRRALGMREFQLWTFLPTASKYVGILGESLAVYYCLDEWSQFSRVDGERIAVMEQEICRKADVVFAISRTLLDRKTPYNPETHLATHGVDHVHFAAALDTATPPPADLAGLPRPIVGFMGLIEEWIDLDLMAYVAEKRPDWSVVLVGRPAVDVSKLRRYPNVHLLGHRLYQELPRYCKEFAVGTCPFVSNELTRAVNPIKLREYLSAGLPVVSTDMPAVRDYSQWCRIATTPEAFLAACEAAIREDTPERRRACSEAMRNETWQYKVEVLGDTVMRVKARKMELAREALLPGKT